MASQRRACRLVYVWSSGSILHQRRGPVLLSTIDSFFKVQNFTATPINSQTREMRTRSSVVSRLYEIAQKRCASVLQTKEE